ncbi:MAG TPA: DUF1330 domain-containing protein [Burkholderiaceae bacterium]|nr:DUF1330 domain-containing protein [Burkholderiaceae bacterium]
MTVHVIGRITVRDGVAWDDYRSRVPATLEPWGGRVLARGRRAAAFDGDEPHADVVVLEFPDLAAATGWHESPAYRALVPLRRRAADVVLTAYAS